MTTDYASGCAFRSIGLLMIGLLTNASSSYKLTFAIAHEPQAEVATFRKKIRAQGLRLLAANRRRFMIILHAQHLCGASGI